MYTPKLWVKHLAAIVVPAAAPVPASVVFLGTGLKTALAPGPAPGAVLHQPSGIAPGVPLRNASVLGPDSYLKQPPALAPGPEYYSRDSLAEVESAQAEAVALPPTLVPQNGLASLTAFLCACDTASYMQMQLLLCLVLLRPGLHASMNGLFTGMHG